MVSKAKIAIVCSVVICLGGVLWMATVSQRSQTKLTYSQFLEQVRAGQVASVIVIGGNSGAIQATGRLKNGNTVRTVLPPAYRDAMVVMQDNMVNVEIRDSSSGPLRLLMNATPFFLLFGVWIFLMIFKFPKGPRRRVLG